MNEDNLLTNLEGKLGVRTIKSDAEHLYYYESDKKDGIGIIVIKNQKASRIFLNRKQAMKLAREFKEVCEVVF